MNTRKNEDQEILAEVGQLLDRADRLEAELKANPPKETITYAEFLKRRGVDIDAIIAATNGGRKP